MTHAVPSRPRRPTFLDAPGEVAQTLRAPGRHCDALGEPTIWPLPLRTALGMILRMEAPAAVFWGSDRLCFFNDALAALLAPERRPALLGRPTTAVGGAQWEEIGAHWRCTYSDIDADVDAPGNASGGLLMLCADTGERQRTAEALAQSEARFHAIANSIDQMIWSTLPDGFHDYYNRRWYEFTGVPEGSTDGEAWNGMFHPDDQERAWAAWRHSLDIGEAYHIEYRLRHHSGQYRWVLGRAQPVRTASGAISRWYGTCTDIETIVQAREVLARSRGELERLVGARTDELMAAEEQLRQAQKMEAVGQLTGGIAHDFNNLLATITSSLELMQRRIAQGRTDNLDRYIGMGQAASRRAAALTHRLLAFSRRQTLDPKPTDVNRLIRGMEDLIRRTIGPSIELEVVGAVGLWTAIVDPHQLENALLNLCINARDAMPDGGRLTIETANKWMDSHSAAARAVPAGQYLSLCVTDTGTGMSPELLARIFEPFFTTKPMGSGTGLGLSMVYGFARQSGGSVRAYSEVGMGSTLCVYLPRHAGPADADDAQHTPHATARLGDRSEVVLVVDDEASVRALVVEALEELGYQTLQAENGPDGLTLLQSPRRIDLLVTDVGLPGGMNGRQMADAGRTTRSTLKVLFITGYAENAVVGNGHLAHGMQIMSKPFSMVALGERVQAMLAEPPAD